MAELTGKQSVFIERYLTHWNVTRAAREAGYSEKNAYNIGHRLLDKPQVKSQIDVRMDTECMSANEALARLSGIARGDIGDFISQSEDGKLYFDLARAQEEGTMYLIKRIRTKKGKVVEVELHDALKALIHIGKYHGLFTQRIQIANSVLLRVVYGDDNE